LASYKNKKNEEKTFFLEGGEGELKREKRRGATGESTDQKAVENTNLTECTQEIGCLQSINSDQHLPQSPLKCQFFR
jgi:hypothetical protein